MEKHYRDRLGLAGKHSPHSWRSVFSTWARDAGKDGDAIEAQLDHLTGNAVQTAYDRAQRLDRRRELMAWHEATLLAARDGAKIVPMRRPGKTRRKGSAQPLLDTGCLINSITSRADRRGVTVGTNVIYAALQQFGAKKGAFGTTRRGSPIPWGNVPARPFLGLSDEDRGEAIDVIARYLRAGRSSG